MTIKVDCDRNVDIALNEENVFDVCLHPKNYRANCPDLIPIFTAWTRQ